MTSFSCLPSKGHIDLGKAAGGVVWDPESGDEVQSLQADGTIKKSRKGAVIARFDNDGNFTTNDKNVAARLKELGYRVTAETKDTKTKAEE